MQVNYYKEYSHHLNCEMEYKVYGHSGKVCIVFPAQDGRFYDYENFKMVDALRQFIEEGRLQLWCIDSVDKWSWSLKDGNESERIELHERWFNYICEEIVGTIIAVDTFLGTVLKVSKTKYEYSDEINALEKAKIEFENRKGILNVAIYLGLKGTKEYNNIIKEYFEYSKIYNQERENFKLNCLDKIVKNNFVGTWIIDFAAKEVTLKDGID